MDQVIQNLWLGDISSISDVENLKKNNIHSILSIVSGEVAVQAVRVFRKEAPTLNSYHRSRPSPTNKYKSTMSRKRTF